MRKALLGLGIGLLGGGILAGSIPFLLAHRAGTLPPPADVIVVLAGAAERAPYARDLTKRGVAPRVLSTLVDPECLRSGKPPRACASGARTTVDEALFMRRVLLEEGIGRALIVTSGYHVPRAGIVFQIVFIGSGIGVRFAAAPGPRPGAATLAHELLGVLPSTGAAIVGRVSPSFYAWLMRRVPAWLD